VPKALNIVNSRKSSPQSTALGQIILHDCPPQEMGAGNGTSTRVSHYDTRTDSKSLLISVDEPDTRIVRNGNVLDTSENDTPESIFRRICALYVAGSTEIRIRAKSGMFRPPQKDMLRDLVRNRLIGTEIARLARYSRPSGPHGFFRIEP
jgi:hypothetical protein